MTSGDSALARSVSLDPLARAVVEAYAACDWRAYWAALTPYLEHPLELHDSYRQMMAALALIDARRGRVRVPSPREALRDGPQRPAVSGRAPLPPALALGPAGGR